MEKTIELSKYLHNRFCDKHHYADGLAGYKECDFHDGGKSAIDYWMNEAKKLERWLQKR